MLFSRSEEIAAVHIANPSGGRCIGDAFQRARLKNMSGGSRVELEPAGSETGRLFEVGRAYVWNVAENAGKETREDLILTLGATGLAREKERQRDAARIHVCRPEG